MMDIKNLNGSTLAYLGDGYFELYIRKYLIEKKITKVDDLHKKAIQYTSGESQAKVMEYLIKKELVFENEINIFKRGRNSKSNQNRKNISCEVHNKSTGFEALIGYLYLNKEEKRLEDILIKVIEIVEGGIAHE